MKRPAGFALAFGLAVSACMAAPTEPAPAPAAPAQRIVSLDYCADQYVLRLADRRRILAISPDATASFAYLRTQATGLLQVRASAEDVLALEPDLVVRSYGGGPNAQAFFARAGVAVAQVPYADDLDAIASAAIVIGDALGAPGRGRALAEDIDSRRGALAGRAGSAPLPALYLTPAGYTSGAGTLIHELIGLAGFDNFERREGWRPLNLEGLAYAQPALVANASFGQIAAAQDAWGLMRHPVAGAVLAAQRRVALDGAWTACGAWFVLDAAEAMAAARP